MEAPSPPSLSPRSISSSSIMPSINQQWSAKDELSLLSSALEIANEPAESYNPRVDLFDRIGINLENSFENRDVLDKLKELRTKYEENFREIREGDDADIMSSASFEISRNIWGERGAIKKKMMTKDEEMGTQSSQHGSYQVHGSKNSEIGDHKLTLKKKMEGSNDSQLGDHQLTSEQNRVRDSKFFRSGAHQPTLKQKSAKVFRNVHCGSSQPPFCLDLVDFSHLCAAMRSLFEMVSLLMKKFQIPFPRPTAKSHPLPSSGPPFAPWVPQRDHESSSHAADDGGDDGGDGHDGGDE